MLPHHLSALLLRTAEVSVETNEQDTSKCLIKYTDSYQSAAKQLPSGSRLKKKLRNYQGSSKTSVSVSSLLISCSTRWKSKTSSKTRYVKRNVGLKKPNDATSNKTKKNYLVQNCTINTNQWLQPLHNVPRCQSNVLHRTHVFTDAVDKIDVTTQL